MEKVDRRYSQVDQEIIILKSMWDSISEMVNYSLFMKLDKTVDTTLRFESEVHQRLFNILLVDFLSPPARGPFGLAALPPQMPSAARNILFHFQLVAENPLLNPTGSEILAFPLKAFLQWLEVEVVVEKVWFPSIQLEIDVRLKRIEFIKICGTIGKHNFARLGGVVKEITEILERSGATVSSDMVVLALEDFYAWFHDDIFSYHSSTIAEFLNNLRYAIYDYLKPEFARSFTRDPNHEIAYSFKYPAGLCHASAESMYWDLMNAVRNAPYMPRFSVSRWMKMRY